jgi:hypothetical protein
VRLLLVLPLLTLIGCGPKRSAEANYEDPRSALQIQREVANEEGPNQTLELARLSSMAIASGDIELADNTLRRVVGKMQDFRADGQFRATIGVESAKEWKGDPFEKMMAFLYLGQILYNEGQYGNALAMTKSAILSDTGTSQERFRADFIPAFVLQAMAYDALGETRNAERSMQQAVDALWRRALTDHLSQRLAEVVLEDADVSDVAAARALLLAGLPAGLTQHPRDPKPAIDAALSYASDLRKLTLQSPKKDWNDAVVGMRKGDLRRAFDPLAPLALAWKTQVEDEPPTDMMDSLHQDETFFQSLLSQPPSVLLWLESGRGPTKLATGQYHHIQRIVPRTKGQPPRIQIDQREVSPHFLDSVTFQAQTRGGRAVDGFLKGKAVFKDASFITGIVLLEAGDVAAASDESAVATVLYILGLTTWVAGAIVNPRADTRNWELLPDALWMARADATPGTHELTVNGRTYTVDIPDDGTVVHLIPALEPGGMDSFGEACIRCEVPLAIPATEERSP